MIPRWLHWLSSAWVLALLARAAFAQAITFAPQPDAEAQATLPGFDGTIWSVIACGPPAATLPAGILAQLAVARGLSPISRQLALRRLQAAQRESPAWRVVRYAGWLATGAAVLTTSDAIAARPAWQRAATWASAFLAVAIPAARKEIPRFGSDLALVGQDLAVPAAGCAEGLLLTSRTAQPAFGVNR